MRFTIFTATYNRGYIIARLYESLKKQSFMNFEWIVIDDCSSDNTEQLFKNWLQEENFFEITYIKRKTNGGKHRAINQGVRLAKGQLFFIVDSDDYLTDDALHKADQLEKTIQSGAFAGIAFCRADRNGRIIGKGPQGTYIDATSAEKEKYHLDGDKAEIFYTDILIKYPFREFEGENFLTEITVWYLLSKAGLKIRWHRDYIYICEYLSDGLSKNLDKKIRLNPQGTKYTCKIYLEKEDLPYKHKLVNYYNYYAANKVLGRNLSQTAKEINVGKSQIMLAIILMKMRKLLKG